MTTGQPDRPLHLALSRHPVAAEAVAELVVQLLESIGFAPPPAVLHLAICGTHALHVEAIVAATAKLIRPRVLTAELHADAAPPGSNADPSVASLSAIAFVDGTVTTASRPNNRAEPDDLPMVCIAGASGTDDGKPITMHWHADRLVYWCETTGTRTAPGLTIDADFLQLQWIPGPRVDVDTDDSVRLWSTALHPTWRGDALEQLDAEAASIPASEFLLKLLRMSIPRTVQLSGPIPTEADEPVGPSDLQVHDSPDASSSVLSNDDPSQVSMWVVWPNRPMPPPLDRLASIARIATVNPANGLLGIRPRPAVEETEPLRLLAVKDHNAWEPVAPVAVSDRIGDEGDFRMPWPASDLFVSIGDESPVPIAGAAWCLTPVHGSRRTLLTE